MLNTSRLIQLIGIFIVTTIFITAISYATITSVSNFGSTGTGNGQFYWPMSMGVDSNNNVYVPDYNLNKVQKFDNDGNFLLSMGSTGTGDGQLKGPADVAVDSDGNIYVTELSGNRIQKFDSSGNYVAKWSLLKPYSIAYDSTNNVLFVTSHETSYTGGNIFKYDTSGGLLATYGGYGTGNGKYITPYGIGLDSSGNIYSLDGEGHMDVLDSSGNFLRTWATGGIDIAVNQSDDVYVFLYSGTVYKYDNTGNILNYWGEAVGADPAFSFSSPKGMAIDSIGNIFLSDTGTDKIYKFFDSEALPLNVAPGTPTSLGGASLVDGSSVNSNQPVLSFTLADDDGADTLKYTIQIDDSSDFSSPVVDYTSALAAQGARSFTVGQAAGSGTYTTGSGGQTLTETSYYWRVKSIDNSDSESSYATANSGSVAFSVDTTLPTVTTVSPVNMGGDIAITSNLVMIFSEAVDVETGNIYIMTGGATFETIDVTSEQVTGTGTTTITISTAAGLYPGLSYYINIDASAFDDAAGNSYAGISDTSTWTFSAVGGGRTADTTAPTVRSLAPSNGASGVPLDANLTITFSELIKTNGGNIFIHTGNDLLVEEIPVGSIQVRGWGSGVITIDPSQNFEYGTEYYVHIANGVFADIEGNKFAGIEDNSTWSFTTVDKQLELVTIESLSEVIKSVTIQINDAIAFVIELITGKGEIKVIDNRTILGLNNFLISIKSIQNQLGGTEYLLYLSNSDVVIPSCDDLKADHWSVSIVNELLSTGAYPTTTMNNGIVECAPDEQLSRANAISWLVQANYDNGVPDTSSYSAEEIAFADIDINAPQTKYILLANALNMVDGDVTGVFGSHRTISRVEFNKVLLTSSGLFTGADSELAELKASYPEKDPIILFSDVVDDSEWYYPFVYFSTVNNLIEGKIVTINGIEQTILDPNAGVTRAEGAKMLLMAR